MPVRMVESLEKGFQVLGLDVGHGRLFAREGAADPDFERRAASRGGKTGSARMNSSPAARAARTPSSELMTPPRAPRAPFKPFSASPIVVGSAAASFSERSTASLASGAEGGTMRNAEREAAQPPSVARASWSLSSGASIAIAPL